MRINYFRDDLVRSNDYAGFSEYDGGLEAKTAGNMGAWDFLPAIIFNLDTVGAVNIDYCDLFNPRMGVREFSTGCTFFNGLPYLSNVFLHTR